MGGFTLIEKKTKPSLVLLLLVHWSRGLLHLKICKLTAVATFNDYVVKALKAETFISFIALKICKLTAVATFNDDLFQA